MAHNMLQEAASRYLTKYKKRLSPPGNSVPDAPKVATRQSPGLVPPRLHKRQPQKGIPRGR